MHVFPNCRSIILRFTGKCNLIRLITQSACTNHVDNRVVIDVYKNRVFEEPVKRSFSLPFGFRLQPNGYNAITALQGLVRVCGCLPMFSVGMRPF